MAAFPRLFYALFVATEGNIVFCKWLNFNGEKGFLFYFWKIILSVSRKVVFLQKILKVR